MKLSLYCKEFNMNFNVKSNPAPTLGFQRQKYFSIYKAIIILIKSIYHPKHLFSHPTTNPPQSKTH